MVKIYLFNHLTDLTLQNSAPRYRVLPHVKLICFVIYRHGFHGNVLQEGIQPSAFIVAAGLLRISTARMIIIKQL